MLLLKLTLAPSLVALASIASRRWGPKVGGWLAGFPMVAGPVLFFYTWEQGTDFGSAAAIHTLVGILSLSAFAIVYAFAAQRFAWPISLLSGWTAFGLGTFALRGVEFPVLACLALAWAGLGLTYWIVPEGEVRAGKPIPLHYDLPLRMAMTAAIVLTLTGLAAWLGPQLSGLLTPFPVATTVLVVFAHKQNGGGAASRLMKGLAGALFGFGAFCAILAVTLPAWGMAWGFVAAFGAAAAFQTASLFWMGR